MIAKLATAVPTGAAITFGLFLLMHSLVTLTPGLADERDTRRPIVVTSVQKETELVTDQWEPPVIPDPVDLPPTTPLQEFEPGTINIATPGGPKTPRPYKGGLFSPFTNDGPLIALVRVEPSYPQRAAQAGLEGIVLVQFDVFQDGTVGNIHVVESSHPWFNKSAIQAASRFRFKARVIDGEPQVREGVLYQFRFEMKK